MQKYDLGILEGWLERGFCLAAGDGKATVCVEQAVALCAGERLTDRPSCVNDWVSGFGRSLNDRHAWSSPKARADGLRGFAYAQLGTNEAWFNPRRWAERVKELVKLECPATSDISDPVTNAFACFHQFIGADPSDARCSRAADILKQAICEQRPKPGTK